MIHRKYFSCESQPQSCKVAIYSLQLTFLGKMQVVLRVREAIKNGGKAEKCGLVNLTDDELAGRWYDHACSLTYGYICERDF